MSAADLQVLDAALLRRWPLPAPDQAGDKEDRGSVLLVVGSPEMPGSALLAAEAALRAGCGKLTLATAASVAEGLALALPEARVVALPETANGGLYPGSPGLMRELRSRTHAALLGPGMMDRASCVLVRTLLALLKDKPVVLDALAMDVLLVHMLPEGLSPPLSQPVIITPHAGVMAHLTPHSKHEVQVSPGEAAHALARHWQLTVLLKGPRTHVLTPEGDGWRHAGGNAALATSGSGDVLAGLLVGLLARGAGLAQAACWAVALQAQAGERLSQRLGPLGVLARELAGEVPALMQELGRPWFSRTARPP
jgi:ADP-dependent NAD(P)H-hydrate dehydratase